jgi:spore germination protein YaaH
MMRQSPLLFIASFALLLFVQAYGALGAVKTASFEVSGWIPYWREATGTQDVLPHVGDLTTIHPFGFTLSPEGIVTDALGIADEPWKSFFEAARAHKVRIIPTVMSGDGDMLHAILSDGPARRKLEDDITELVMQNNFDGIDIDFESKLAKTKPYFSLFLKGLYSRMGKKWVYCTIESRTPISSRYEGTPPKDAGLYANDFVEINKYCDRVQIMAYDQGTIDIKLNQAAHNAPYAPVADPLWVEKVMKVAAQVISKRKLIVGIPTYGYEFTVTPLAEQGFRYDRQWAFNPKYATDLATTLGLTPVRNTAGELSFSYIPPNSQATSATSAAGPAFSAATQTFNLLWWDDAISIAQKINLAKQLGVRGVAIFKLDGGQAPGFWDVLSAK